MTQLSRRSFMKSMLAACAAPAIVKASSLMKIYVPQQELIKPEFRITETISMAFGNPRGATRSIAHLDELAFYKPAVGELYYNRLTESVHVYTGAKWHPLVEVNHGVR